MTGLLVVWILAAQVVPSFAAERHQFDISAEPAIAAINDFATQARVQILVAADILGNKQLNRVVGDLSTEEGLRLLLADSGFEPRYVGDRSIALVTVKPQKLPEGRQQSSWDRFRVARVDQGAPGAMSSEAPSPGAGDAPQAATLNEVIVTAQKREEKLENVPAPVSVLNTDQLAVNDQVRLKDYYATVPGLNVTPNLEAAQQLSIRGISTGDYTNPTVGVLVDDALYTSALMTTYQVPDVDPGDLARVEVLRGPQGTLYGANSMGGIIKYVTLDPSTAGFTGWIQTGANTVQNGTEPGYNLRAAVNIPVGDSLAVRASAFTRQDPGYINNPGNCDGAPCSPVKGINEAQADGFRVAALWRPSEDVSLKLSALSQDTRGNGLTEVVKQPGLSDLQQNYAPGVGPYDGKLQAYSANLKAKLGGVDLTSVTAYNSTTYRDTWDPTGLFKLVNQGALWTDHFSTDKFMQEIRLSGSIWNHLDWLGGLFYTHEHGTHEFSAVPENLAAGVVTGSALDYGTNPVTYQEYAAFADLTYHFTDRFDVQVGGRESHIQIHQEPEISSGSTTPSASSSANAFTYLLTPRFKLSSDVMLYARFASGYRPGGPNPSYAVQTAGASSSFSPDTTYNYEAGLKGDFFDRRVSLDASVFYIDWRNIQIQESAGAAGWNANGGNAKSEGLEVQVAVRPTSSLVVNGWLSYDNAVLTQAFPASSSNQAPAGARLPDVSRFSGNLSARQSFPLWTGADGFVGAQANFVGDRVGLFTPAETSRQFYPGYVRTDLNVGLNYRLWSFVAYVNNVANDRGVINAVFLIPNAYVDIQPRTVGISASTKF